MRQPEPLGLLDVLVDVALGVDDGSDPGALVRDQVRRVGQAAEVVLLEDHRSAAGHAIR